MEEVAAPPKFVVLEKSLIGNRLHEAGEEVTLPEGTLPADNLAATCDEGRKLKEKYEQSNADRIARMRAEYTESAVGDASAFAGEFRKMLAENNAQHAAQMAAMQEGMSQAVAAAVAQALVAASSGKPWTPKGKKAAEPDPA
jgi:hypothetical protein